MIIAELCDGDGGFKKKNKGKLFKNNRTKHLSPAKGIYTVGWSDFFMSSIPKNRQIALHF